VPSAGTWLRRCGASAGAGSTAGLAGSSPLVIVIVLRPSVRSAPRPPEHAKTLATRRGSLRSSVIGASVALVPPCPSVLPPGARNEEAKKALKAGKKRAKKIEERYVVGLEVAQGHVDTSSICRHDDGDAAAAATLEEVQATRLLYTRWWRGSRSLAPVSVRAQPPRPQPSVPAPLHRRPHAVVGATRLRAGDRRRPPSPRTGCGVSLHISGERAMKCGGAARIDALDPAARRTSRITVDPGSTFPLWTPCDEAQHTTSPGKVADKAAPLHLRS
jgi:hypothetical protein